MAELATIARPYAEALFESVRGDAIDELLDEAARSLIDEAMAPGEMPPPPQVRPRRVSIPETPPSAQSGQFNGLHRFV